MDVVTCDNAMSNNIAASLNSLLPIYYSAGSLILNM